MQHSKNIFWYLFYQAKLFLHLCKASRSSLILLRYSPPMIAPLMVSVLFLSVPKILVSHFAAMNKMECAYTSSITALSINVILNLILIPAHGMAGAAIATSISYLLYAIINIQYYLYAEIVELKYSIRVRYIKLS